MTAGKLFDSFLRIMGLLFTLGLLVAAASWCWPYATALAWHVQHGNRMSVGPYQVPVQLWARPDPHSPSQLEFHPHQFGYADFRLESKVTPGDQRIASFEALSRGTDPRTKPIADHFLKLKRRQVMVAGQPTLCFEDLFEITCVPRYDAHGLTTTFAGFSELAPTFYDTLSKVMRSDKP